MIGLTSSRLNILKGGAALLLLSLGSACGSDSEDPANVGSGDGGADSGKLADGGSSTTPTVVSTTPSGGDVGVFINAPLSATFSEPMENASLDTTTFTLTSGAAAVPGKVLYANSRAVFWPAARFATNAVYTATITSGAKSARGVALGASYTWSFTTGASYVPALPVNLGLSGHFAMLAKAGISAKGTTKITGDLGVSPAAASYITGFSLSADATNVFATTPIVIGKVYAADYAPPTPADLTTAVTDMELAFTDVATRAPDVTELGAGNVAGMTLIPGVYKWGTGLLIPVNVTLAGSQTDIWIFQIAQGLTMESGAKVLLSGGALPKNIYWQVAGRVDLGTTAHLEGSILAQTGVTMRTGASINGRVLAQTASSIEGSVTIPAP
jgi:Ice-binding-like/Bacterial Ig-like domain